MKKEFLNQKYQPPTPASPEALRQDLVADVVAQPILGQSLMPTEFPGHVHSYLREIIALADQKAGFVFTLAAAVLAFLLSESVQRLWLIPIGRWAIGGFVSFAAMGALVLAAGAAALVVLPRMSKSHEGVVFFRSIALYRSADAYAAEILALKDSDISRALLRHSFDLAKICQRKYVVLVGALWLLAVGVIGAVGVLILKPA